MEYIEIGREPASKFATKRASVARLTVRLSIGYGEGTIKLVPIFGKAYGIMWNKRYTRRLGWLNGI